MYGLIWRKLPGPDLLRFSLAAIIAVSVGLLLWYVVFPEIAAWLAGDDAPTVVEGQSTRG